MKTPKKPTPRRQSKPVSPTPPPGQSSGEKWHPSKRQQDLLAIGFIALVIIILHFPLFFNQRLYDGGDSHEALVKTSMINHYYAETGETPRWNPYPEAGIPNVFFLPKPFFSLDFIFHKMGDAIGISIVYLLIGAIGMYFLLRYLRFNIYIAVTIGLAFVLAPYYRSLIIVGQFLPTKFEAAMLIPWVVWPMMAYIQKHNFLYAALFSVALSVQLATQHYQVIYYTGLLVFAIGLYPLIRDLSEKRFRLFFIKTATLVGAALFALLLVAYPLFVSKKYNDASIRATWGIDITKADTVIQKGSGVSVDFIREWSPASRELIDLLVPAASGGSTKERYKGNEAPQLSGTELQAYWGKMTFSFSYLYFGLIVILAIIGLIMYRKDPLVISLGITGLVFILWSLGTTLEGFYLFFYEYLPFFRNFRTPPTSMTVVYFILSLLAAFGLRYLFAEIKSAGKNYRKNSFFFAGGFLLLGLLFYINGEGMSFTKPGENYEPGYATLLQSARKEMFFSDIGRYFLFVLLLFGVTIAYAFRALSQRVALVITGLLIIVDLTLINNRYTNELLTGDEVQARYFPPKPVADFFKNDKEVYRVLPVTDKSRDLSAVVPIIGDHDLQVLTSVYEINTNNLYRNIDSITNINWNVLKVFGVKYFVADRQFFHPQLTLKFSDPASSHFVYQFNAFRGFGHFVNNSIAIPKAYDRLKKFNDATFDPAVTAMLEKPLPVTLSAPDSTYSAVTKFTPNEMVFDVYTSVPALFVIPLNYVSEGWEIAIDGNLVKDVHLTNHAVQSVVVPAGKHVVSSTFNKSLYKNSYLLSAIATGALYFILFLLLRIHFRNKTE